MGQRLELHAVLIDLLGSSHVYFQPPPTVQLVYPCIVYQRDRARTEFADDKPYNRRKSYQVTVIDSNPDSLLPDKVAMLPTAIHERFFAADNLNHDVFRLFF
jgi:hypothetical protein